MTTNESINDLPAPPKIDGESRKDDLSRQLYSTDASIYKVHPYYVLIPQNQNDLKKITRWAHEEEIHLIPRGGGTSLSGQSIGRGAIVDYSRKLNNILSINPDQETVLLEPGVVLDHLNNELSEYGLQFGPDVATSDRATIGGMIGNDSAGAHSIQYGNTSGHVKSLKCQLANGEVVTFEQRSIAEAERKARESGLEGQIYDKIPDLIKQHASEIRDQYPDLQRNVSGYGLDRFLEKYENGLVDMTQLICGSEGTLATVLEAELELVDAPRKKGIVVLNCESLEEAMKANQTAIDCDPYAVELLDEMILSLAQDSLEMSRHLDWLSGAPRAVIIVELAEFREGNSLDDQMSKITTTLRSSGFSGTINTIKDPKKQKSVWKVRKSGLPLLLGISGDSKPTTFIEDTAVSPDRLVEYIRDFQNLVSDHDTKAAFYGHSSVGCLHIRPLINLKSAQGLENMRDLARDAVQLVKDYEGAISGEHGDGRARSEWLDHYYGSEITELFKRIKTTFDPGNILNPGNITEPQNMTENLRFGSDYETRDWDTVQDFSEQGGHEEIVELCNGSGVCRKEDSGTMCPSFMATRKEKDSTRGRANALRGLLDGDLEAEALTDGRLKDVMDLCISCKACKSECPSNVDMAPLKEEIQHKINNENGVSLRERLFGNIGKIARGITSFNPILNWLQKIPGNEFLIKKMLEIAPDRNLPEFSSNPLDFDRYPAEYKGQKNPVVLLPDSFNAYLEPEVARSAIDLIEKLGFDPIVPEIPCCGRPMMSKGLLEDAQSQAKKSIDSLEPFVERQIPVVGLEPSCVSAYTDDYPRYVPGEQSKKLAEQTQQWGDFLFEHRERLAQQLQKTSDPILLHGHCHQKALFGTDQLIQILEMATTESVQEIDSGCCGMAGSFGYEKEHYSVSRVMAERKLVPTIDQSDSETIIAAPGISCRQQIDHFTNRRAKHPARILADRSDRPSEAELGREEAHLD